MTREERVIALSELKNRAEQLATDYNSAILEERYADAIEIDKKMVDVVKEHGKAAQVDCFIALKGCDDPMLEAVKRLNYQTIAIKDEKGQEDGPTTRKIVDRERAIDLRKLHKFCEGIGYDEKWIYMVEKFNMTLTARKAEELGIDPKSINDSYAMAKIAKEYDLGKNPASKTNILKTLTTIVTAMLGEGYKPVSHDVNYLLTIYAKKNRKALTVTCANHKFITQYIAEICHRIVTGASYGVEYKKEKSAQ